MFHSYVYSSFFFSVQEFLSVQKVEIVNVKILNTKSFVNMFHRPNK